MPHEVTVGYVPRSRFVIYRDGQPITQNSSSWTSKTAILNEPTVLDIDVRNNGFAPLTLSTGELPGFTITSTGQISALSNATLQVRLDATGTGSFSGLVAVNTNDPDRPQFTLNLSGDVVSPTNDADGDGMNDAAEVALYGLGFRWQSYQPALVTTFYENVSLAGLHEESEIMDIQWKSGAPVMNASGETISVPLEMNSPVDPSSPLLLPGNVHQKSGQVLDVSVALPVGKRFVRLKQP